MKGIIVVVISVMCAGGALAQMHNEAPSSLHPGVKQSPSKRVPVRRDNVMTRNEMVRIYGGTIETRKEFVARMEKTARTIRKREREMKKPQYSNPLYFGHKRPPKKHRAGKLKFCKECGIRH